MISRADINQYLVVKCELQLLYSRWDSAVNSGLIEKSEDMSDKRKKDIFASKFRNVMPRLDEYRLLNPTFTLADLIRHADVLYQTHRLALNKGNLKVLMDYEEYDENEEYEEYEQESYYYDRGKGERRGKGKGKGRGKGKGKGKGKGQQRGKYRGKDNRSHPYARQGKGSAAQLSGDVNGEWVWSDHFRGNVFVPRRRVDSNFIAESHVPAHVAATAQTNATPSPAVAVVEPPPRPPVAPAPATVARTPSPAARTMPPPAPVPAPAWTQSFYADGAASGEWDPFEQDQRDSSRSWGQGEQEGYEC
jgi:hypothetical protein